MDQFLIRHDNKIIVNLFINCHGRDNIREGAYSSTIGPGIQTIPIEDYKINVKKNPKFIRKHSFNIAERINNSASVLPFLPQSFFTLSSDSYFVFDELKKYNNYRLNHAMLIEQETIKDNLQKLIDVNNIDMPEPPRDDIHKKLNEQFYREILHFTDKQKILNLTRAQSLFLLNVNNYNHETHYIHPDCKYKIEGRCFDSLYDQLRAFIPQMNLDISNPPIDKLPPLYLDNDYIYGSPYHLINNDKLNLNKTMFKNNNGKIPIFTSTYKRLTEIELHFDCPSNGKEDDKTAGIYLLGMFNNINVNENNIKKYCLHKNSDYFRVGAVGYELLKKNLHIANNKVGKIWNVDEQINILLGNNFKNVSSVGGTFPENNWYLALDKHILQLNDVGIYPNIWLNCCRQPDILQLQNQEFSNIYNGKKISSRSVWGYNWYKNYVHQSSVVVGDEQRHKHHTTGHVHANLMENDDPMEGIESTPILEDSMDITTGGSRYDYIKNPKTNRHVKINSRLGKYIINQYKKQLN